MGLTILAVDVSGSTAGYNAYHRRIATLVNQLKTKPNTEVIALAWDDKCKTTTLDTLFENTHLGKQKGYGGTCIIPLFEWITTRYDDIEDLIIVTDGEIPSASVDRVYNEAMALSTLPWKHTTAHVVSHRTPSATVIAPFIQRVPYVIYGPQELVSQSQESEVTPLLKSISTPEELEDRFQIIHDRLVADTLVHAHPSIRQEILRMQSRLTVYNATTSTHPIQDIPPSPAPIEEAARAWYATQAPSSDIISKIHQLIQLCDTAGLYMDLARFERHFKPVDTYTVTEDPIHVEETCEYEDPIMMDPDMPVAVFTHTPLPLLDGIDESIKQDVQRCPLNFLKYPILTTCLLERTNPIQGLKFTKESLCHQADAYDPHQLTSPFTRNNLIPEIFCFGNHPTHVKANKACLANLLTGTNRLCGQYGLWMIVMWWVLKQKAHIQDAIGTHMSTFIREFVLNTPSEHKVFMGLDGTGKRPTIKVCIATALLYTVLSTKIWCLEHTERDMMRDFHSLWQPIQATLSLCDIDVSNYSKRVHILKTASKLLWQAKQYGVANILNTLRSKWHKTLFLPTTPSTTSPHILLDALEREPDENEQLEFTLLNQSIIDTQKKFGSLIIPWDLSLQTYDFTQQYTPQENSLKVYVPICPATLRPYVYRNGTFWKDAATNMYGDLSGQVSVHYQLLVWYQKHRAFPDADNPSSIHAFMEHLARCYKKKGTLPLIIYDHVLDCIQEIQDAIHQRPPHLQDPSAIIRDIQRGSTLEHRIVMERTCV